MSKIEWTDRTWNPVRGCSLVSPGCTHCYAMKTAHRFSGEGKPYEGLTTLTKGGPVWTGKVRLVPELLDLPLRWRKPQRVFVNSMSDLFHEEVPDEFIDQVFAVMAISGVARSRCTRRDCDQEGFDCEWGGATPRPMPIQTYQVLTKRQQRMHSYLNASDVRDRVLRATGTIGWWWTDSILRAIRWPLPNVWLGISAEDQTRLDERLPLLLDTPAAVRFVSAEPLLGPLDFYHLLGDRNASPHCDAQGRAISWVIVGGESGPGMRRCDVAWVCDIVRQCQRAEVPVFVKQDSGPKPGKQGRIPDKYWVQEFP